MPSPFLTARWQDLVLVTYALEPALLEGRLAPGLELDTIDGQAFASLVAFDFLETRVKGVKWPGFVNFPEINLRFYVREVETGQRGVMFVRELVPSTIIAWAARTLYNEPYEATRMRSQRVVDGAGETNTIEHVWEWEGREHRLALASSVASRLPEPGTTEHFFKEHQWGFGVTRGGEALVYEVRHPHWEVHEVESLELDVDFGSLYGSEFAVMNELEPYSVVHAVGSEIEVYPYGVRLRIKTPDQGGGRPAR